MRDLLDKTRQIIDLVQHFGDSIKGDWGPEEQEYQLQGVAKIHTKQEGLAKTFVIIAAGAEIHARMWRGSLETPSFAVGGQSEFDRIHTNAVEITDQISAIKLDQQNRERSAASEVASRTQTPSRYSAEAYAMQHRR